MVRKTKLKVAASLPISFFIEDVWPDEADASVPQEVFEKVSEKWDNMSDEEKLELIEGIQGRDLVENLSFVDRYTADVDWDHDEVLYE